jgi:hypothetical protein
MCIVDIIAAIRLKLGLFSCYVIVGFLEHQVLILKLLYLSICLRRLAGVSLASRLPISHGLLGERDRSGSYPMQRVALASMRFET